MYSNNKHGNFSNCSTMAVILFFVLFFALRWQVDVCCWCLFSCGNLTEKTNKKIKRRCYHYNYPLRVNNWVWNSGILTVTKILLCRQKSKEISTVEIIWEDHWNLTKSPIAFKIDIVSKKFLDKKASLFSTSSNMNHQLLCLMFVK